MLCELCFGASLLGDGTFLSDGPDFHHDAIGQTRTVFGDGHRLVETVHLKQEVTANRFRSEERRVGKECRSRWAAQLYKQKKHDEEPSRLRDRRRDALAPGVSRPVRVERSV